MAFSGDATAPGFGPAYLPPTVSAAGPPLGNTAYQPRADLLPPFSQHTEFGKWTYPQWSNLSASTRRRANDLHKSLEDARTLRENFEVQDRLRLREVAQQGYSNIPDPDTGAAGPQGYRTTIQNGGGLLNYFNNSIMAYPDCLELWDELSRLVQRYRPSIASVDPQPDGISMLTAGPVSTVHHQEMRGSDLYGGAHGYLQPEATTVAPVPNGHHESFDLPPTAGTVGMAQGWGMSHRDAGAIVPAQLQPEVNAAAHRPNLYQPNQSMMGPGLSYDFSDLLKAPEPQGDLPVLNRRPRHH